MIEKELMEEDELEDDNDLELAGFIGVNFSRLNMEEFKFLEFQYAGNRFQIWGIPYQADKAKVLLKRKYSPDSWGGIKGLTYITVATSDVFSALSRLGGRLAKVNWRYWEDGCLAIACKGHYLEIEPAEGFVAH